MKSTYRGYTVEATSLYFGRILHTITAPNGDVIDQRATNPKYLVDRTIAAAHARLEAAKARRKRSKKPKKPVLDTFVADGVQYELQAVHTAQWSYSSKTLDVRSIRGIRRSGYRSNTVWANTDHLGTIQVKDRDLKVKGFVPPTDQIAPLELERKRLVEERDAITHYDADDFRAVLGDDSVTLTCADLTATIPLAITDGQVVNRETGEVLVGVEFDMVMLAANNGLFNPGYGLYFLNQSDMNAYVALDTRVSAVGNEVTALYNRESEIVDTILNQYKGAVAEYEAAMREWKMEGAA